MHKVVSKHLSVGLIASIAGTLLMLNTSIAYGGYAELNIPNFNRIGTLSLDNGLNVSVQKRMQGDFWSGDTYTLLIRGRNNQPDIIFPFTASYGRFYLYFPKLSGTDIPNVVLISASGKGTSATTYYLYIYSIDGSVLKEIYKKLIAGYYSPSDMWSYNVDFDYKDSGTEEIKLSLDYSPPTHGDLEDISLIPKSKYLIIYWDAKSRKFVETKNAKELGSIGR